MRLGAFVAAPTAQTPRVRARDPGIVVGTLPPGSLNAITDAQAFSSGTPRLCRVLAR